MKKWAGVKTLELIERQCAKAGIHLDMSKWVLEGSDHVVITSIKGDNSSGRVMFNTVNGRFFGTTPEGVKFNSDSKEHDREEWFQKLLAFFYIEKA
jgi:hypothetical protein